jgi:hypothetical protein
MILVIVYVNNGNVLLECKNENSVRPTATECNLNNPLPVHEFGSLDGIYLDAPLCY